MTDMLRRLSQPPTGGSSQVNRRHAFPLLLGTSGWLGAVQAANRPPVRLAISESVIGEVNLNDARAAMQIWIKRMTEGLNVLMDQKLFSTTAEIVERTRKGQLDAAAMNIIEYRQVADLLDSGQIVNGDGADGFEQYVILVKRNGGIRHVADLKGRRICTLKTAKMCVAPAWLVSILSESRLGPAEQFFGPITTDAKFSRVVLPVFFGQIDACLTTRRGFDTMSELNPQVGRELQVLASSPPMVVDFYIFCKSYPRTYRESVIRAISSLHNEVAGQQLATLFQFRRLTVRDAGCLTTVLGVLENADRTRSQPGAAARKG